MTPDKFRSLALSLPETVEGAHMDHPDFRVRGKIFATLGPDEAEREWGMVKLPPDEQQSVILAHPDVFESFNGAWGRQGCTKVWLDAARVPMVRPTLIAAWRNTAPKGLVKEYDADSGIDSDR